MAEGNDFSKDFENLETLITCGICADILTEPKSLPKCLHTFCFACIQRWAHSCQRERKLVRCPSCRKPLSLPGGNVASLTTSFHHKSLIQVYNSSALRKRQKNFKDAKATTSRRNDEHNQMLELCVKAIEQSDSNMKKTDKEIDLAVNEVRRNTSSLVEILHNHEKAIVDQLNSIHTKRKAEHEQIKSKISNHIQEIIKLTGNKYQELTDMNIEHFAMEDFQMYLDASKNTIERTKSALSTINQVHCDSTVLYTPNPKVIQDLKRLQIGEIQELTADPSRCSIECVQPTRCGFINQFGIVTRNSKGDICYTNKDYIDVNIQDNDGDDVQKKIIESQPGQFAMKFRVENPSPCNFVVSIIGQNIKKSPRTISAIDAKAEFKPVRFFQTTRASCPVSLAMNSKGDIAVVNNNNRRECRIVLYSPDGEYVRDFGGEGAVGSQLNYPRRLTFTNDDHILVSDNTDDGGCIKKYHIDGRLLRTVYEQKGMAFTRMCTTEQSIACLSYNKKSKESSIMLFSKETSDHLQDIKLLAPSVIKEPIYITYGHNKYFVSFHAVHTIYVFDENGGLLYTIGEKGDKQGQFYRPCGLAVFGADMLLVCDYGNHRTQLFHQDGVFIRSFGTPGSDLGQMNEPVDVAVAPDGQVFILEKFGKRIQVFR